MVNWARRTRIVCVGQKATKEIRVSLAREVLRVPQGRRDLRVTLEPQDRGSHGTPGSSRA